MSKKQRNEQEFVKQVTEDYLHQSDWRVNENASAGYSIGGLIMHGAGAIQANYWLNEVYPQYIADAHKSCALHLHDLSMLAPYCSGWSLRQLIEIGFGGVEGQLTSAPAKHLNTLMQHIVNFLGVMANQWAGACAFSSLDTYLAPFIKKDNLSDDEIRQAVQNLIFGLNISSRWNSMPPFSNVTIDWTCPRDLKDLPAIVGGEPQDFTYGDCQIEMDRFNKIFMEVLIAGDASGRGFQYPIPTYNITDDFDWEHPNAELLFTMTSKYGTPYFAGFINSDLDPSDVRSMCCRLRLDKRELRKRGGGLFGSDEFTGSIGVVTINLPQIAYLTAKRHEVHPIVYNTGFAEFKERLFALMDTARDSLEIKRKQLNVWFEEGLYPYTKRYLKNFNNHFNTIGICGMNEACLNLLGKDISTEEGKKFAEDVLVVMRERLIKYQQETGNLYNLEATPAESTSYRLAKHDKENYPDIITSGDSDPYYTNSTQLPVGYTADVFDALDHQESLQTKYTGGTVFHVYLGEAIKNWKSCRKLVKTILESYKVPYISISPIYSICKEHGYLNGKQEKCPKCGAETEIYERIVGYYRPRKNWNAGKKAEEKERVSFNVEI